MGDFASLQLSSVKYVKPLYLRVNIENEAGMMCNSENKGETGDWRVMNRWSTNETMHLGSDWAWAEFVHCGLMCVAPFLECFFLFCNIRLKTPEVLLFVLSIRAHEQ